MIDDKTQRAICSWCQKVVEDSRQEGGEVHFTGPYIPPENDKELMLGAPTCTEWFCGEHYPIAQKLSHLSPDEAFTKLGEMLGFEPTCKADLIQRTWWQRIVARLR